MVEHLTDEKKIPLCDFFFRQIELHPAYISHGEIQMGVADNENTISGNGRELWLKYIDRQQSLPLHDIWLYIDEKDQIGGFVLAGITDDGAMPYGVVYDLCVDPAMRNRGIGTMLMNTAFDFFNKNNVKDVYLESGKNNHLAHRFFEKYNFEVVSHIFRTTLK